MRTTLTIEDDVAAELERLRRSRDSSFKDVVNDALRRGLRELTAPPRRRERFQTQVVVLGRLRLASLDDISESIAIAEGEAFK